MGSNCVFSCKFSLALAVERTSTTNLPFKMKRSYLAVLVTVNCTKFGIEEPTNSQAQYGTWSTYKNTNTLDLLFSNVLSFVSFEYLLVLHQTG